MPSTFAETWSRASSAIDRVFGESFLYTPMLPNPKGGRPIADAGRQSMIITGALTEKPTFTYPETRSRRSSVVAQEATQEMMVDIANAALPYDPQSGDRLTQVTLDAAGEIVAQGGLYEVAGPQPDGIARTELRVFKLRAAP